MGLDALMSEFSKCKAKWVGDRAGKTPKTPIQHHLMLDFGGSTCKEVETKQHERQSTSHIYLYFGVITTTYGRYI
jgi:hypothetical protein